MKKGHKGYIRILTSKYKTHPYNSCEYFCDRLNGLGLEIDIRSGIPVSVKEAAEVGGLFGVSSSTFLRWIHNPIEIPWYAQRLIEAWTNLYLHDIPWKPSKVALIDENLKTKEIEKKMLKLKMNKEKLAINES